MKLFAMGVDANGRSITTFVEVPLNRISETESISARQDGLVWRIGMRNQGEPLAGGMFEMHFGSGPHFVAVMSGHNQIGMEDGGAWRLAPGDFMFVAPGALHHSSNVSTVPVTIFNLSLPGTAETRNYTFK